MTDIASLGIRVTTQGVKEATRDLDKLSKEGQQSAIAADKTGKAWGKAFGIAAAGIVVGGVTAIIKATIEADRVQAQLEARVKSLGASSIASVAQIDRLATSLQGISTFDDEKIKSAATSLLAFTNIDASNFERTLRDVTDLASATGDDLVSSADRIGKALNNPLTASRSLREIGIELSATQKSLIKDLLATGRAAEAQAVVLGELEKRFSGAAEASRNTLGGALKGLKNDFDNLLEGDGKGVTGTTEAINGLAATMRSESVRSGFAVVTNGLFSLAGVAAKVVAAFATAGQRLGILIAEMVNQAKIAANIARQVQTFGLASGTISEELAKSRAGNAQFVQEDAALIASFQRVGKAAQQAAVNVSGYTKEVRGKGQFANVNTDPVAPVTVPKPTRIRTGGGGGGGAAREAIDLAGAARSDLDDLIAKEKQATEAFQDMAATLAGPLASAQREHEQAVARLNQLAKESPIAAAGLSQALDDEAARYKKVTDEINGQLTPYQELLKEKENDLRLMGLQGVARDLEIDRQRLGIDLTKEQTDALRQRNQALEDGAQSAHLQQVAQDALSDSIYDFVTGAKSAKDAAKSFFDSIAQYITRMIAENWAKKIGGMFSGESANGGAGGGTNWFSAIVGLLGGGGGRAIGGPVSAGSSYEVGENDKPELLKIHNKQYLIPGNQGNVVPIRGGDGGKVIQNFNTQFVLPERYSRETQSQIDQRRDRMGRRAASRN